MSLSADAMRLLAAKGLSLEEIIAVAEANGDASGQAPTRSKAAERTARWRARQASQTVTVTSRRDEEATVTVTSPSVTNRHAVTPLARVEDNLSTTEVTGLAAAVVSRDARDDWPEGSANHHAQLLIKLAETSRLDFARQTGLVTSLGRIPLWRQAGASWEFDVVPIVTTIARKTGPPIKGWDYFTAAVLESVAANRKALEIPEAPRHERPNTPAAKRTNREGNFARSLAGFEAAAHGRGLVAGGG